jgi:3-hydroxyisobutyrate dehydrogenase-like beta-hydroxyacid dehydrogenase
MTAGTTVGFVGAGEMGSGLGRALLDGGHEVVTTLAGRSARTRRLVDHAGLSTLADLDAVVRSAAIIIIVTPPAAALEAAKQVADACRATGARPLVADLNAVAPATMEQITTILATSQLGLVDGAISGPSPTVRPGATVFLSGPRAHEVASLRWGNVTPRVVGGEVGSASAVKMCTASVYKGLVGLFAQAMRTAAHHGVLEHVLADLAAAGHRPAPQVAVAVTKAHRFGPEMREIAATQASAGLPGSLFEGFADVYEELARTAWARHDPESVDRSIAPADLVTQLGRASRPAERTAAGVTGVPPAS